MADGNRSKDNRVFDLHNLDESKAEELMQTLLELNHSVSNMNKLLQQLQKNIANNAVRQIDAIATKTLH